MKWRKKLPRRDSKLNEWSDDLSDYDIIGKILGSQVETDVCTLYEWIASPQSGLFDSSGEGSVEEEEDNTLGQCQHVDDLTWTDPFGDDCTWYELNDGTCSVTCGEFCMDVHTHCPKACHLVCQDTDGTTIFTILEKVGFNIGDVDEGDGPLWMKYIKLGWQIYWNGNEGKDPDDLTNYIFTIFSIQVYTILLGLLSCCLPHICTTCSHICISCHRKRTKVIEKDIYHAGRVRHVYYYKPIVGRRCFHCHRILLHTLIFPIILFYGLRTTIIGYNLPIHI